MYEIFEQLLLEYGITTYKFCKETGISQSTISTWKTKRYLIGPDIGRKISDFFGVSLDYLMTGIDDSKKEAALIPIKEQDIKIYVDKIMEKLDEAKDESLYYDGIKIQVNDSNRQLFKDALNIAIRTLGINDKGK